MPAFNVRVRDADEKTTLDEWTAIVSAPNHRAAIEKFLSAKPGLIDIGSIYCSRVADEVIS